MLNPRVQELLEAIEELPETDKWQIVKSVIDLLEHSESTPPQLSWRDRLLATYGILSDDPIERPPQLPLEDGYTSCEPTIRPGSSA